MPEGDSSIPVYELRVCTCHCGCRREVYAGEWSGRCVRCVRADDPSSGFYRGTTKVAA